MQNILKEWQERFLESELAEEKKGKEGIRLPLNRNGKLLADDSKKVRIFIAFLATAFTEKVDFNQVASFKKHKLENTKIYPTSSEGMKDFQNCR